MLLRVASAALATAAVLVLAPAFVPATGPSTVRPERLPQVSELRSDTDAESDFSMNAIRSLAVGTAFGLLLALGAAPAKAGLLAEAGGMKYDDAVASQQKLVPMGKQAYFQSDQKASGDGAGIKAEASKVVPGSMATIDVANQFAAPSVASLAEQSGNTSTYAGAGFEAKNRTNLPGTAFAGATSTDVRIGTK